MRSGYTGTYPLPGLRPHDAGREPRPPPSLPPGPPLPPRAVRFGKNGPLPEGRPQNPPKNRKAGAALFRPMPQARSVFPQEGLRPGGAFRALLRPRPAGRGNAARQSCFCMCVSSGTPWVAQPPFFAQEQLPQPHPQPPPETERRKRKKRYTPARARITKTTAVCMALSPSGKSRQGMPFSA